MWPTGLRSGSLLGVFWLESPRKPLRRIGAVHTSVCLGDSTKPANQTSASGPRRRSSAEAVEARCRRHSEAKGEEFLVKWDGEGSVRLPSLPRLLLAQMHACAELFCALRLARAPLLRNRACIRQRWSRRRHELLRRRQKKAKKLHGGNTT